MPTYPTFGLSPYYNPLRDWLYTTRNADGTVKSPWALSTTPTAFTALNGSSLTATLFSSIIGTGTVKQRGLAIEIAGASVGTTATDRIAAYFGAQTGGTAGNGIWGLNIVVQANSADTDAQAIGLEVNVNNNKTDVPSNLSGSTLKYGYSADSGGSKIAGIAYAVSASGAKWQRGFRVGQGSIEPGGSAFEYRGNGSGGVVTINEDSTLTLPLGAGTGIVSVYDPDTAGSGFRALRVPN